MGVFLREGGSLCPIGRSGHSAPLDLWLNLVILTYQSAMKMTPMENADTQPTTWRRKIASCRRRMEVLPADAVIHRLRKKARAYECTR